MPEYKEQIATAIGDAATFVRATFSGATGEMAIPWLKVTVRPVSIKGSRHVQFAYYDARKCITKNFAGAEIAKQTLYLLSLSFRNVTVESTADKIQVQVTSKGKVLVHRGKAPNPTDRPDLSHDRQKRLPLPAHDPDPFLKAVGIMTDEGKVRAEKQRKFRQINEFLKLVEQTIDQAGGLAASTGADLSIVDCGCGNAYLTFATYHYFQQVRGIATRLMGIDVNGELLARHAEKARHLGWTGLTFHTVPIIDFRPPTTPAMVLALHACDTATDEALAQAIKWGSTFIFCAPCCHHHLQQQLDEGRLAAPMRPLLRHGILTERLGDLLTDNFRALLLRIMGYQTEVVEFVETEHTAKNLLIRAVKRVPPGEQAFVQAYLDLKRAWQVTPYLEELLGEEFAALVEQSPHIR